MWQRIQYVGWNLLHIRILAQYQGMHCLFLRCCASSKFLQWLQTILLKVCYWVRNVCYRIEILRQWRSRLVSNYQLNAQFLYSITIYMLHYIPQHVSSSTMLIFGRTNWIITASGIVTLCKRPYSMPVETGLHSALNWHTVRPLTESDDTRCCNNTICPPEDEHSAARNMLRIIM